MLGGKIQNHLRRISDLYFAAKGGEGAPAETAMTKDEVALVQEMKVGVEVIAAHVSSLGRRQPITIRNGTPKGSWAHVYYVSFHDHSMSSGPTEGFYPVFLLSVDRKIAWICLIIAAKSVGISGKGGWSKKRGAILREKAKVLGAHLAETECWKKGPVNLGSGGTFLHEHAGSDMSAGKGYECGAIISAKLPAPFDTADPGRLLAECFGFSDAVSKGAKAYVGAVTKQISPREDWEQENAAILGAEAERFFLRWAKDNLGMWGRAEDRTGKVGLGYDTEFPKVGFKVEVKGFREEIEGIRLTQKEVEVATKCRERYYLALVSNLRGYGVPNVRIIRDPIGKLDGQINEESRIQITFTVPSKAIRKLSNYLPGSA